MNISNRVFAYPVLSSVKEDYKESTFVVECNLKPVSVAYLELEVKIDLISKYLQELINNFSAEYVVHLECTSTGFRKIIKGREPQFKENIPVANLNDKFEVVVMIITKKDIEEFSCDEFSDDFEGEQFYITKSSILAYENMSFNLILNQTEFIRGDSIFSISKDFSDTIGKMKVELGQKKITIRLRPSDYQLYVNFCNKKNLQSMFNAVLVLPALVYVIGELKLENGIETYETTEWYQSLKKTYELKGLDFVDALDDEKSDALTLAQELMEYPIANVFENLRLIEPNLEDD